MCIHKGKQLCIHVCICVRTNISKQSCFKHWHISNNYATFSPGGYREVLHCVNSHAKYEVNIGSLMIEGQRRKRVSKWTIVTYWHLAITSLRTMVTSQQLVTRQHRTNISGYVDQCMGIAQNQWKVLHSPPHDHAINSSPNRCNWDGSIHNGAVVLGFGELLLMENPILSGYPWHQKTIKKGRI